MQAFTKRERDVRWCLKCVLPIGMGVCVCLCVRAHMCIHTCAHVYLCMSVEGLLGEKHMGVVGRADKLKHKTANSKERGIL